MLSEQDRPTISIVTPSFCQGRYIEQTILSVLNQGYPNLEYIIVDGGSTDGTLEILKKYEPKLRWISELDRGQSDAINKGWRISCGEILAYLNSDDFYEPGAFENVSNAFSLHPHAVVVYGDCFDFFENGHRKLSRPPTQLTADEMVQCGNMVFQPASFFRRSALEQVGFLDVSLHYWMDYDLFIRLARIGRFVYVPHPLANFRVHSGQKSRRRRALYREARRVSRKHGGRFFSQLFWEHHPRLFWMAHQGKRFYRALVGRH